MTFQWCFHSLTLFPTLGELPKVLHSVRFRLFCFSEGKDVFSDGILTFSDPSPGSFIPFSEISYNDMVNFAEQTLGSDLDPLKEELTSRLSELQPEPSPLPWTLKG